MATIYEVELPDGRILEVEGDRPPTRAELAKYMEPAQPSQRRETPLDLMRERGGFAPAQSPIARKAEQSGAAALSRYGVPMLQPQGGPTGALAAGAGESLAQIIEGTDDNAARVKATAMGSVPLQGAAKGITGALKAAGKMGGASVLGDAVGALLGEGQNVDSATRNAGLVAGVTAAMPLVGRLLGKATGNVAPEEIARIADMRLNNANKDAVLARMTAEGASVVPSSVNPSLKNKVLESIAGIQNVEAGIATRNQPVFNRIGRREASLPPDAPINETTLGAARNQIAEETYRKASQLGFGEELNQWRSAANQLRDAEKKARVYTVERGAAVDEAQKAMDAAEMALDAKAKASGMPDALEVLQEAKQAFGKNYDVEQAVLSGTDEVRPGILAALLEQRGEAGMTGGLRDVAQFNNAFGRSSKNPTKMATAPGAASAGMSMVAGGGNPAATAVLIGGVPTVRGFIRDLLVSPEYQAANARRNYTPSTGADPRTTEIITRLAALLAAQKENQ